VNDSEVNLPEKVSAKVREAKPPNDGFRLWNGKRAYARAYSLPDGGWVLYECELTFGSGVRETTWLASKTGPPELVALCEDHRIELLRLVPYRVSLNFSLARKDKAGEKTAPFKHRLKPIVSLPFSIEGVSTILFSN